jgi:O-antigen/teichoic acid export membrane protein
LFKSGLFPQFRVTTAKNQYLSAVFASLVSLVVVSIYSLLVIRLSLIYLGKEEYGLLSLLSQVSNYIAIIDFGLYTAFSRILIDYTSASEEKHANALKTASRVFQLLGLVGFLLSCVVAFCGAALLSVPPSLNHQFQALMIAQGATLFVIFAAKPFSAPLFANGKQHVIYWASTIGTIITGFLFWVSLKAGAGIYSSLLATGFGILVSTGIIWHASRSHLDSRRIEGNFDSSIFKEVFSFAKDSLLWQIGGQTLSTLPIILVSSWFSLTAAADLSAGMKMIILLVSVCTRLPDMSVAPLSIQFASGNDESAIHQMKRIAGVAGGLGCCAALGIICVNPSFISWWMVDKVTWSWHANLAGAYWIAIISLTRCIYSYAVVCRKIEMIRWGLFLECSLYLIISFAMRPLSGAASLVWAMPLATLISGIVMAGRIRTRTTFNTSELLPTAFRQFLILTVLTGPSVMLAHKIDSLSINPLARFFASCGLAAAMMIPAYFLIFSKEMHLEINNLLRNLLLKCKINLVVG